ncbi:MAG: hypothetical protein ACRCX4_03185 [Bacteroidales bacterium]
MKVKKNILYLLAGLFWLFAGINVIRIGIDVFRNTESRIFVLLTLALFIFLLFFRFIFARVVHANVTRIKQIEDEDIPFWKFMDRKGYLIMIFMMSMGITIRYYNLLPDFFIAFFYIGLGGALSLTAFKYLRHYFRK